jgi:hypothetical protein
MNLPETMEPPLSPAPLDAPLDGLRRAPAPDAEPTAAAEPPALSGPPPLTTRLLRMGLVTLPQLSGAMAQQAATGRPLEELLVEMGLVSADDLAKLDEPAVAPPPAPVAAPALPVPSEAATPVAAPVAAPAPAAPPVAVETPVETLAPAVPAAAVQHFAVVAELENGAKLDLGVYSDPQQAREAATYAMRAIRDATSDWPVLGGRYVRPQSVISIEVTALL